MTVAGAARSGLAAAELLARRGARVTLSDTRSEVPEAEPLTRLGVQLELGGHQSQTFTSADLVVLSPGVPPETPADPGRARSRRAGDRRDRAGVPLAAGARDRDYRHERQVDDDGADRTDARSRGLQGDGRRQHRRAAERAGGRVDARHVSRRRDQQLPAGADRHVPPVDRGDAEFLAGPPRSAPDRRRVCGGEGADLREPGRRAIAR